MDTGLIVLVSVVVGAFALGYYMDWFDLWVSKDELKAQIDASKVRMQCVGQNEDQVPEKGATTATGTEASADRM